MPYLPFLLAGAAVPTTAPSLPECRPAQLRLSADGRDGAFNGMSHAGVRLTVRNVGPDCLLPALPLVQLRDASGRVLPAARGAPVGMHPGPALVPVRLSGGHAASTDIRWVSAPVFPRSRSVRASTITLRLMGGIVRSPLRAVVFSQSGLSASFSQTPFKAVEGMAAG